MTYRIQIITAKGEPVIDAKVWGSGEARALMMGYSNPDEVMRWKEPNDRRWRYMIAGERVQSTKELTEAFRVAGMFEKGAQS